MDELAELSGRLDAAKQQVTALQQELVLAKREHADAAATSEHRMQVKQHALTSLLPHDRGRDYTA